jgi:hypothetical protein
LTLSRRERPILRVRREPRHPSARYRSGSLCSGARLADGELVAQCEELAVGGGERGLERGDRFSAAALLMGDLGREFADDVARRLVARGRLAGGRAARLGAELRDSRPQRWGAAAKVRRAVRQARDGAEADRLVGVRRARLESSAAEPHARPQSRPVGSFEPRWHSGLDARTPAADPAALLGCWPLISREAPDTQKL